MKVYVSGPMTGIAEFNYPAFEEACRALRALSYDVVSPHEINPPDVGFDHTWEWYLRRDLVGLLECDAVAVLPGWMNSKGASLETYIARKLGMPVYYLPLLLDLDSPLVEIPA